MSPRSYEPSEIEAGRLLFAGEVSFVLGAKEMSQIPTGNVPEIAFAGRSNVGKSSLLNALIGHKKMARTSNTPGRTREVNFFDVSGHLMLADLPGYGYARAAKSEIDGWTRLIEDYLRGRVQLRRCCLLIDARHGLKDSDRTAMKMMDQAAQNYQIVLTKCDKVKPGPLGRLVEATSAELAKHGAAHPDIMRTSSRENAGIPELRAELASLAE
ncbi:ribosome biogenesis GTP-binding protein YihA/YsxC [Thalassospiraceae bacterium LMO-JJ14]|nr:ribosome biogenesis GTP-binding protein YihA/YsxC [Thalassospiraceae bacterium LMO-JJ14]